MIILYAQKKGGVGKTTLAVHHAVHLFDLGYSVALLDADEQRQAAEWATEAESNITIAAVTDADDAYVTAQDLESRHDFTIIDGPATLGEATRALMTLSDLALIPMGPSILDLRATDKVERNICTSRQISGNPARVAIVLNKVHQRTRLTRETIAAAADLGIDVLETRVRDLQAFPDAAQQATVVTRLPKNYLGAHRAQSDLEQLFSQLHISLEKVAHG
ncbi:MAG: AAA family ATPase [Planctomycetales bacterium]|nr:AAA family ATPase [Planctomycetales bacterium]